MVDDQTGQKAVFQKAEIEKPLSFERGFELRLERSDTISRSCGAGRRGVITYRVRRATYIRTVSGSPKEGTTAANLFTEGYIVS